MRFFLFIALLCTPLLTFGQAKRAQSMIDKGKTMEAMGLLQKALQKDSLATGEKYVLATILFNRDLGFYDLDSSYYYILQSIEAFVLEDLKAQSRLTQDGFGQDVLDSLKRKVEFAGYSRAKGVDQVEEYLIFMEKFPTSLLIDSAIILRDKVSFRKASGLHTYSAYLNFIEQYPQALDVPEAKKRYEKLLFEDKTHSGLLKDLQDFLVEYPNTWHREETERAIYRIITGRHSPSSYQSFIDQYPESNLVNRAKLFWYSLLNEEEKKSLLMGGLFDDAEIDSILINEGLEQQLLTLSRGKDGYFLINTDGEQILGYLQAIGNEIKCKEDFKFLLIKRDSSNVVMNLAGQYITEGNIEAIDDYHNGLIRLKTDGVYKFIAYSGLLNSTKSYTNASMVGPFIAFEESGKYGLESITGIRLHNPIYDSLVHFHNYILLEKDKMWAMEHISNFYPALDKKNVEVKPIYTHLEVLNDNYLLVEKEDASALLNREGKEVIPMRVQSIELLEDGYFLESYDSILDSRLANRWYLDITSNQAWTVGDKGLTHDIYYAGTKILEVEAATLLGPSAIITESKGKRFCYFNPDSRISISEGDEIKPIRKMGEQSTIRHYLFTKANKKQIVINQEGKHIKLPRFDKLIDLGEDYMIFSVKGFVYNILDGEGNILLRNVDAATGLGDGYISYLSDGKFGLFNGLNDTHIKAKYDRPLQRFKKDVFIAEQNDQLGLINQEDSLLLPIRYEEVMSYNDSIAILKNNFRWTFYNLKTGAPILDNVSDYWEFDFNGRPLFKIFRGVGYGIWSLEKGIILNSTYGEIEIKSNGNELIYIAEKWVEEADIVIMLYYNKVGDLIKKVILTTADYEDLICLSDQ